MLSVLLLGFHAAGRQAATTGQAVRTLAALVPATVDGVVRDLCLAGPDGAGFAEVADHAGCTFVQVPSVRDACAAGGRHLRQPTVLLIHAGTSIDRAVIEELTGLLPLLAGSEGATWVLKADRRDLLGRLFPILAPIAGLVCPRAMLLQSKTAGLADLARHARTRRTMRTTALLDI